MLKVCIERKSNVILDIIELQKQGYTDIHFKGHHLTGGVETSLPYNECFFGELDSKGECIESKPIYHLIDKGKSVIVSEAKRFSNNIESNTNNNNISRIGNLLSKYS